ALVPEAAEFFVKSFTKGFADLRAEPLRISPADSGEIYLTLAPKRPPWVKVSGRVAGMGSGMVVLAGNTMEASAPIQPDGSFEFARVIAGRDQAMAVQTDAEPETDLANLRGSAVALKSIDARQDVSGV